MPSISFALRVAAVIIFVFAAFGFNPSASVAMIPIGLACWCGSTLV